MFFNLLSVLSSPVLWIFESKTDSDNEHAGTNGPIYIKITGVNGDTTADYQLNNRDWKSFEVVRSILDDRLKENIMKP